MVPAKYETLLFQLIISCFMSCLVSGAVSLINLGFDGFAFAAWMKAWVLAWSIAFPTIVVMMPFARKLTHMCIKSDG